MRACVPLTAIGIGSLFMLLDSDALIGVTMANRALTPEEWAMYSASPSANRRRKPGESIDDDEERERRKRVIALMQEIHDQGGEVPSYLQGNA